MGELVIRGSILSDRLSPKDQERVELPELARLTREIQDNVMSLRAQPIRQAFSRNMITFSLASFDLDRTKEELFEDNKMMKNVAQLGKFIDSLQTRLRTEQKQVPRLVSPYYTYLRFDTTGRAANRRVAQWQVPATRLPVVIVSTLEQAEFLDFVGRQRAARG